MRGIENAKGGCQKSSGTYQQALADTGAIGLERIGVRLSVGNSGNGSDKGDDREAHGEKVSVQGGDEKSEKSVKKREGREGRRGREERVEKVAGLNSFSKNLINPTKHPSGISDPE